MDKHVVIVGGGLGGLAAGMVLSHNGFKVTILEKNNTLGGKLQEIHSTNGYNFDVGPTLITLPFVFENLFKQVGRSLDDYLKLIPLEVSCQYHFRDHSTFNAYTDPQKFKKEFKHVFSDKPEAWELYYGYIKRIYEATKDNFIFNPLTLGALFKQNPLNFFHIDAFSKVHAANERYFHDPRVQQFLNRFPTYVGSSPYIAPATLNVIPYVELAFGSYTIKGGLYRLVDAFKTVCEEEGCHIHLNQEVQQILVENKKVNGVKLKSGETIPCDAVVSNSDAAHTYLNLLNCDEHTYIKPGKIKKWEPSCSGFILCLGINKQHCELEHHNIFFSENYKQEFNEIFKKTTPASQPTIYVSISSKTNPKDAPKSCENWFVLVNAPHTTDKVDWEKIKYAYRDQILAELEHFGFYNLKDHIKFEYILTPKDLQTRYHAFHGAIYGTSSNKRTSAFLRPKNRSPYVKGLYLATGSAHPGGGTPMVTLSGTFAANLLMQDMKKMGV